MNDSYRNRGGANGWNCPPYQRPRNREAPKFNNHEIKMFGNGVGPPWVTKQNMFQSGISNSEEFAWWQWQGHPYNDGMAMGRGRGWMPHETMGRGHWRRGGGNEWWDDWSSPGEGLAFGHNRGWAPNYGRARGRRWSPREDVTSNHRWKSFNDGMSMTQGRLGSQNGGKRGFGYNFQQIRGRGSKSLNEGVDFGLNASSNEMVTTPEDVDPYETESILDKNIESSNNVEISKDCAKKKIVSEINFAEVNNEYLDPVMLQQAELEFQVQPEVLEFVSKTWRIAKQEMENLRMRYSMCGGG